MPDARAPESDAKGRGVSFLRTLAFLVVSVAGLKLARDLLVPVIMAAFVTIICAPFVAFLVRRRVPHGLAVVLVLVVAIGGILLSSVALVDSLTEFSSKLPEYQETLQGVIDDGRAWLEGHGIEVAPRGKAEPLDFSRVLGTVGTAAGTAINAFSSILLVLLTVVFMLGEAVGLPAKLRSALGKPEDDLAKFHEVGRQVWAYLGIKTILSLLTGVLWGIYLAILGVDYPILWGLLAFAFNFIPNIGSVLAAIPAVLLALLQGGPSLAGVATLGVVVINQVIGNVVEPKVMGARLGLSPLVVFLSLIFWSWLWGPVGMLLSVPLTQVVKILLESSDDFRSVAVLLGPDLPPASESPPPAEVVA